MDQMLGRDPAVSDAECHRPTLRVLDILEALAASDSGLTLTEIAASIHASKSTIFPIIRQLASRKYIQLDKETSRYRSGIASAILSGVSAERNDWLRVITDEMQRVVNACDEVSQLGILDGENVLYVRKIQARRAVRLVSHVGTRMPASATALGKALICELTDQELMAMYPRGLPTLTQYGLKDFAALRRDLDGVLANGYAIDNREVHEDIKCYAVPLRHRGKIVAAISVSVPVFRDSEAGSQGIIRELLKAESNIESMFNASDEVQIF
ncbi:MAG: IclR family transcriptional regulator [Acetobacteraceae bacterium]|nr:IclR family transcriptional regulator [Acetobacteraceae bacterium]